MIYLCIPAHNEEQTVGVVLWKIRQVMAELQRDYQLLVADDASTDRTQDVLEPYTRVLPLTVLRNAERRGYAASLEMLLREAVGRSDYPKRDIIITLQADFTDEPGHVGTLVKRIESGADIVTSNMLPLLNVPRLIRWRRPALNALLRRLGWPDEVRDPLNGFAAYRVFCIRKALDERKQARLLSHEGWSANAELLHLAAPHARRVDAVEQRPHPERLQRTSRFQFMAALKQVLGLRRGRVSASQLDVGGLRPSSVMGGPSSQRSLVAESLRNGTPSGESAGSEQRRSRNGGQRTRPQGSAQRGRRPPQGGGDARSSGERTGDKQDAASRPSKQSGQRPQRARADASRPPRGPRKSDGARPPRQSRTVQGEAAASTAGADAAAAPLPADVYAVAPDAGASENEATASAASPKKRARRGRRGGGRARRTDASPEQTVPLGTEVLPDGDAGPEQSFAGGSAPPSGGAERESGAEDGEAGREAAAPSATGASDADDAGGGPSRRRRSNRRGGRGRRRRNDGQPPSEESAPVAQQGDDASFVAPSTSEPTPQPRAS